MATLFQYRDSSDISCDEREEACFVAGSSNLGYVISQNGSLCKEDKVAALNLDELDPWRHG